MCENLFKIFLELHKCVAGRPARGWDARRGVQPIARLLANAATPQTARQDICPKGWSEIGPMNLELWRPGCLRGHEPMRRIQGIHSSRLHSNAIPQKDLEQVLSAMAPSPPWLAPKHSLFDSTLRLLDKRQVLFSLQ